MVLLIGIVVGALAVFFLRVTAVALSKLALSLAHEKVGHHTAWHHAHGDDVKQTDECQCNANTCVHGVLCVEDEEWDEAHEEALAVEEAEELEIFQDSLPLELSNDEECRHGEQVEGEHVIEGVCWGFIRAKVGESDNSGCDEGKNRQEIENLYDVEQAGFINMLHLGVFLIPFHFKLFYYKLK